MYSDNIIVTMSFLNYKSNVEVGDTVIVYTGHDAMFPVVAKTGETTQTKYGAIKHNYLIGHKYGTKLNCSKVCACILYFHYCFDHLLIKCTSF